MLRWRFAWQRRLAQGSPSGIERGLNCEGQVAVRLRTEQLIPDSASFIPPLLSHLSLPPGGARSTTSAPNLGEVCLKARLYSGADWNVSNLRRVDKRSATPAASSGAADLEGLRPSTRLPARYLALN